MGGLLTLHMQARCANGSVRTAGFGDPGLAPTDRTVVLLRERGIDVSGHRSRRIDESDIAHADIVVTAERMHVVEIAGRWPEAFTKTMTLPEVVALSGSIDRDTFTDIESWLGAMGRARHQRLDYLAADDIGEIGDPTGHAPSVWRMCSDRIDELTRQLADVLAPATMAP